MVDIVSLQNDKSIRMFNSNAIASDDAFPRNRRGFLNPNAMRYPDLIANYGTNSVRFTKNVVQDLDMVNTNFYAGMVRTTTEIIQTNV